MVHNIQSIFIFKYNWYALISNNFHLSFSALPILILTNKLLYPLHILDADGGTESHMYHAMERRRAYFTQTSHAATKSLNWPQLSVPVGEIKVHCGPPSDGDCSTHCMDLYAAFISRFVLNYVSCAQTKYAFIHIIRIMPLDYCLLQVPSTYSLSNRLVSMS